MGSRSVERQKKDVVEKFQIFLSHLWHIAFLRDGGGGSGFVF